MSKARKDNQIRNLPKIPDINEEIFKRAGITEEDRALLLRKVFDKTVKRMSATTIKTFNNNGEVVYSKPLADHATQGKAIDQAMVLGLTGVKKQEAPKVTIKAVVHLPSFATKRKNVKDITPSPEVITHESSG
jgi:hypothetical protein